MAFERLIFACRHRDLRPEILSIADYRRVLENAGMQLEERRFKNRLPLAHVLIVSRKPVAEFTHNRSSSVHSVSSQAH
jgi:hypothetical protein